MSNKEVVLLSLENHVATLTINRPESLNALNLEVLKELSEKLDGLSRVSHKELSVVLLRGAGEKAFVAGADIKFMQTASQNDIRGFIELGQRVTRQIEELPFPVIAVLDGFAIGGGLEIALAADLIVAHSKAKLGQAEVNLGIIPGFGGTQRLLMRTGLGPARRLILSGDPISAKEGYELGLVDWLCEPDELENTLQNALGRLLLKGPLALSAAKRAINHAQKSQLNAGMQVEADEFFSLFNTRDTKEGLAAFVEKRKAEFCGE